MNDHSDTPTITRRLVPEEERFAFIEKTFSLHFALAIEPAIFTVAGKMADAYDGGHWDFYSLSNSSFYAAPQGNQTYKVVSANLFEDMISSQAFGLVVCQTVFSHLSFSRREELARLCAKHYYLLRDYVCSHAEARSMLKLLD